MLWDEIITRAVIAISVKYKAQVLKGDWHEEFQRLQENGGTSQAGLPTLSHTRCYLLEISSDQLS